MNLLKKQNGNDKKRLLQQKIIEDLSLQNEMLKAENKNLQDMIIKEKEKSLATSTELKQMISQFHETVAELNELKESYLLLKNDLANIKKEYRKKMRNLLKELTV